MRRALFLAGDYGPPRPRRGARATRSLLALLAMSSTALASPPDGAGVVRVLGARHLAPSSGSIGALVAIPPGTSAASLGVEEVAPGIGRMRGSESTLLGFASAHPDLPLEVVPPLRLFMDRAAVDVRVNRARLLRAANGQGTLVGIVDTGLDVAHPDFKDDQKKTRVAWILDLSHAPLGLHPDLEQKFGVRDDKGNVVYGAVMNGADIDGALASNGWVPKDEVGHGTHVAGIVGASGTTAYQGMAPKVGLVIARVTRTATDAIESDDLLRGTAFVFDRGDAENKPIACNISLGSDFGPHDGTMLWERVMASYVGPTHPGRAIVAAAGNSGSIAQTPIHQVAYVSHGGKTRVPFFTGGTQTGSIQVWVTERATSKVNVGLEGPNGELVGPVPDGEQRGKNEGGLQAGVIHGSKVKGSLVPESSRGSIVVITGQVPAGDWNVTLQGEGTVDLYLQATGSAYTTTGFRNAVRESTITLPATHPDIIGVGCTVSRTTWTSIGSLTLGPTVPLLDAVGGTPVRDAGTRPPEDGEVCWFSGAGPTLAGVAKPDIAAPGSMIIASMSAQAAPGSPSSIFTDSMCPPGKNGADPRCLQVDDFHAVSMGTSFSSPIVAGAVALLFQKDPTLTQETIKNLLQAGAHQHRGPAPFFDQNGPGELDVLSSIEALDEMRSPAGEPSSTNSWITVSADYVPADGSIPIVATIELRTEDPLKRASLFEDARLAADVRIGSRVLVPAPKIVRKAPGLFQYTAWIPNGFGGERASFGATFDGQPIVGMVSIPISADPWNARYDGGVAGGCSVAPSPWLDASACAGVLFGLAIATRRRRR